MPKQHSKKGRIMMITTFIILVLLALLLLAPQYTWAEKVVYVRAPENPVQMLTNAQRVWLYSLQWHESRGNPNAINPKDRDGTPSYGCYQFKPGTFDLYSKLFGVATTSIMSCAQQTEIVAEMILHRDQINWHHQFPVSVSIIGLPPKKSTGAH